MIIDPGGDDTYLMKGKTPEQAIENPMTVILDLGGDDLYRGGDFTFGGTFFGSIGLLYERDGRRVTFTRFTLEWLTDGRDKRHETGS